MSKNNIGSNFDEFLTENVILDESTAAAIKSASAWQLEQELKARWIEIEQGDVELSPASEVFSDIQCKLQ